MILLEDSALQDLAGGSLELIKCILKQYIAYRSHIYTLEVAPRLSRKSYKSSSLTRFLSKFSLTVIPISTKDWLQVLATLKFKFFLENVPRAAVTREVDVILTTFHPKNNSLNKYFMKKIIVNKK